MDIDLFLVEICAYNESYTRGSYRWIGLPDYCRVLGLLEYRYQVIFDQLVSDYF